ncbi:MAG: hypothetical protein E7C03_08340 [Anaerococcus sp.]|nr:hypothetical protein [Anaerococcus sp.]
MQDEQKNIIKELQNKLSVESQLYKYQVVFFHGNNLDKIEEDINDYLLDGKGCILDCNIDYTIANGEHFVIVKTKEI